MLALTTMLCLVIEAVVITITAPVVFDAPLSVNWLNYALVFGVYAFAGWDDVPILSQVGQTEAKMFGTSCPFSS